VASGTTSVATIGTIEMVPITPRPFRPSHSAGTVGIRRRRPTELSAGSIFSMVRMVLAVSRDLHIGSRCNNDLECHPFVHVQIRLHLVRSRGIQYLLDLDGTLTWVHMSPCLQGDQCPCNPERWNVTRKSIDSEPQTREPKILYIGTLFRPTSGSAAI
jgi:hypothetical protein